MTPSTLSGTTYQVGIDIAKQTLACWLQPTDEGRQADNNASGFTELTGCGR